MGNGGGFAPLSCICRVQKHHYHTGSENFLASIAQRLLAVKEFVAPPRRTLEPDPSTRHHLFLPQQILRLRSYQSLHACHYQPGRTQNTIQSRFMNCIIKETQIHFKAYKRYFLSCKEGQCNNHAEGNERSSTVFSI